MRVVAGTLGGRRLIAPAGSATRPTSDRVREALFSVLGDVTGAAVLDLFAGSGALGIEALSRGAARATFVERAPAALRALRANLDALGLEADVRRVDALRYVREADDAYDLVFLDPPYRDATRLGAQLHLRPVLAPGARVVAESDRRAPLAIDLPLTFERRYGDTLIRIHGD
ncbi:MAG TPA: 16S rRNA (guanine(966)-N(2))-methyltransferase RsmD [Solirubrobacteraceae bacterium]|nr:16S rRNA (guanine(966)-N(2))-methyltransferase RsmD [Solirubrobacteraceae bacterium]